MVHQWVQCFIWCHDNYFLNTNLQKVKFHACSLVKIEAEIFEANKYSPTFFFKYHHLNFENKKKRSSIPLNTV